MAGPSPATNEVNSMLEAEQPLRVVMQDLVGRRLGEPEALDIGKGLPVDFPILQYRIVAAGHQVVLAKGFEGAEKGRLRAVAHGVVIEFPGGDARRLGEVGMAPRS